MEVADAESSQARCGRSRGDEAALGRGLGRAPRAGHWQGGRTAERGREERKGAWASGLLPCAMPARARASCELQHKEAGRGPWARVRRRTATGAALRRPQGAALVEGKREADAGFLHAGSDKRREEIDGDRVEGRGSRAAGLPLVARGERWSERETGQG